jgi:hypothetical protein
MRHQPLEIDPGRIHNTMLGQASDTVARIRDMPELMVSMLKGDKWHALVRPADGKRFENLKLEDWVLGPPWGGLNFGDWATLYGVLEMNAECGSVCIRMLEDRGAPEQEGVQRKVDKAKANIEKDITAGRPPLIHDNVRNINDEHGNSRAYTLRRLARHRPDLLAAYENGKLSANAAAIEAGFRQKPSPLDTAIRAANKLTTAEEREEFKDKVSWL